MTTDGLVHRRSSNRAFEGQAIDMRKPGYRLYGDLKRRLALGCSARANGRRRFYTMYSLVVICIHYVIMETWHRITKKGCCGLSASWGCSARVTCNRRAF